MTKPTIHLNGDTGESLGNGYLEARRAVVAALEAVCAINPNGRNFYPQGPDALRLAQEEQATRLSALNAVSEDLLALADHCFNHNK